SGPPTATEAPQTTTDPAASGHSHKKKKKDKSSSRSGDSKSKKERKHKKKKSSKASEGNASAEAVQPNKLPDSIPIQVDTPSNPTAVQQDPPAAAHQPEPTQHFESINSCIGTS
ncbi:hypothetical protein A2U01_0064586, partial [Trifolium medium]|nr:hypothetical protein [Trifolium medium]